MARMARMEGRESGTSRVVAVPRSQVALGNGTSVFEAELRRNQHFQVQLGNEEENNGTDSARPSKSDYALGSRGGETNPGGMTAGRPKIMGRGGIEGRTTPIPPK